MNWIKENWIWLLPLMITVLSAINRATVKWHELKGPWHKKIVPALLLLLLDLVSVLRSKGDASWTKLPLTTSLPRSGTGLPPGSVLSVLLFLVPALCISGCASWKSTTLKTTHTITTAVNEAHDMMEVACKPTIAKCRAAGCNKLECCPELQVCFDRRTKVVKGLDVVERSVLLTLVAIQLGERPDALKAVESALVAWRQVMGILTDMGLDMERWTL